MDIGRNNVKSKRMSLLIIAALMTTATAAAGSGGSSASPGHLQDSSRNRPEQQERQRTVESHPDRQVVPVTASRHDNPDRLLDKDQERLRELEEELARDRLNAGGDTERAQENRQSE